MSQVLTMGQSIRTSRRQELVTLTMNGRKVEAAAGQTVLAAATAAGIDIPTLCHHPAISAHGGCRMRLELSTRSEMPPARESQKSRAIQRPKRPRGASMKA